jgi:DNA-directed RNA polymerase specialized sigma24 family protein
VPISSDSCTPIAHGLSYAEIAETMGIAESTVEKHLIRAAKSLRDRLSDGLV